MTNKDLIALLSKHPDNEIICSVDIDTNIKDKYGDNIIAKVFGYSIVDAFSSQGETVLHFEESGSGGYGVDVIEVVKLAQKVVSQDEPNNH